jgi:hypothetical protein
LAIFYSTFTAFGIAPKPNRLRDYFIESDQGKFERSFGYGAKYGDKANISQQNLILEHPDLLKSKRQQENEVSEEEIFGNIIILDDCSFSRSYQSLLDKICPNLR